MSLFIYIPIIIFSILLFVMSNKQGTQISISQLAKQQWILLLIAIISQLVLLYPMIEFTPLNLQWIPFIGCGSMLITGATNIFNKEDELIHVIFAIIAFLSLSTWVFILNIKCLLPLLICLVAGKQNIKWRLEVGLIISVYMTLLFLI